MPKKILLNDVGIGTWGWAVIEVPSERILDHGVINMPKANKKLQMRVADDNILRVQGLYKSLRSIMRKYDPDGLLFEMPHGGAQNANAMGEMARAAAVASILAVRYNKLAEYYSPNDIKKVANIAGRKVPKELVQLAVRDYFGPDACDWEEVGEHEYDSLAVFIAAKDGVLVKSLSLV